MKNKKGLIGKIILLLFLLCLIGIASWFLYQNLPGETEQFEIEDSIREQEQPIVEYSKIKQFYNNMRFNHNQISYFIEPSCTEERNFRMEEAFSDLHEKVTLLSFYSASKEEADILVGCSEDYLEPEENLFIAGEGGPTEIINTSLYNIITKGKILLYRETQCETPLVELHELLHVFGFDHSQDPKNIMYNFSACDQKMGNNTIDILVSLYSIEALPDLYISNISASKSGRYLNFEIEVKNRGLSNARDVSFLVSTGEKEIEMFSLEEIEFGAGKKLKVTNLKLPSRSTESVKFTIDSENLIQELNKNNNQIDLSVS